MWTLNPVIGILIRRGEDTLSHRERPYVKTKTEMKVVQLYPRKTKDYQK